MSKRKCDGKSLHSQLQRRSSDRSMTFRFGSSEVLRILKHYMREQSQGHHSIDRLEKRGAERGSARQSSLKGREKAIVNETNGGTVSNCKVERPDLKMTNTHSVCDTVAMRTHEDRFYKALFSAPEYTRCTFTACHSERVGKKSSFSF